METYVGNEWLTRLLEESVYNGGFEREHPLLDSERLERELFIQGYVNIGPLRRWAYKRYPKDSNLARYTWQVLLRSGDFFQRMYPGFKNLGGRDCELDIMHIATGMERGKWLADGGNLDTLLDVDDWAIGIGSLKNQFHKLYVHDARNDGLNLCRDGFGHRHLAYSGVHLNKYFEKAEETVGLKAWHRQAQVQGVNPCIYSVIEGWIPTLPIL